MSTANTITRFRSALSAAPRWLRHAGWPHQATAGLLLLAAVAGAAIAMSHPQTAELRRALKSVKGDASLRNPTASATSQLLPVMDTTAGAETYLDDLDKLFKLAKQSNVSLGIIEYKAEANGAIPWAVKTLDIRVNDDYVKLKGFLSSLLGQMPNASLREIRIEKRDNVTQQTTVLIKLALVYSAANGKSGAETKPTAAPAAEHSASQPAPATPAPVKTSGLPASAAKGKP